MLRNVLVDARNWLVFDGNFAILPGIGHQIETLVSRPHQNVDRIRSGEAIKIEDWSALPVYHTEAAFLVGGMYNYYHFSIDYFANLLQLDATADPERPRRLLIDCSKPFQIQTTLAFGYGGFELLPGGDRLYSVGKLHVPRKCFTETGELAEPAYVPWVRRRTSHITLSAGSPRRIYVSRAGTASRRVRNEQELVSALADWGFETVRLDHLPVVEQIRLFGAADFVVGAHGAGLTNVIHARAGGALIELMPADDWRPEYYRCLAEAAGLSYFQVHSPGRFGDADFEVDVYSVIQLVQELGA